MRVFVRIIQDGVEQERVVFPLFPAESTCVHATASSMCFNALGVDTSGAMLMLYTEGGFRLLPDSRTADVICESDCLVLHVQSKRRRSQARLRSRSAKRKSIKRALKRRHACKAPRGAHGTNTQDNAHGDADAASCLSTSVLEGVDAIQWAFHAAGCESASSWRVIPLDTHALLRMPRPLCVAYRVLQLVADGTPQVSTFRLARMSLIDAKTSQLADGTREPIVKLTPEPASVAASFERIRSLYHAGYHVEFINSADNSLWPSSSSAVAIAPELSSSMYEELEPTLHVQVSSIVDVRLHPDEPFSLDDEGAYSCDVGSWLFRQYFCVGDGVCKLYMLKLRIEVAKGFRADYLPALGLTHSYLLSSPVADVYADECLA